MSIHSEEEKFEILGEKIIKIVLKETKNLHDYVVLESL
jgi:hypothetical protein